jgi:ParB family transcriptional regulator, chromosome partitioning protein
MSKLKKTDFGLGVRALLRNLDEGAEENPVQVTKELVGSVAMLPTEQIEVNPFNPRHDFDAAALQELANSIKTYGLIQPVTVRRMSEGSYQLISGERRFRASKIAGLSEIPAYIRLANDDQEMLEMALVENIQREDLNSIEVANTYQRLIEECKLTHEAMSERVGKKRSTISNYLGLLKLPPEIQSAVKNQQISMGHARCLVGVKDLALQLMLFRQILTEDLSVRDVEKLITSYTESKQKTNDDSKKANPKLSDAYKTVQDQLRHTLGAKILLKPQGGGKGQIVINFSSDDELNRIFDTITKE